MEKNINVWLPLPCPLLGTWPATQACALIGNRISGHLLRSLVLNPLSQGKIFKSDLLYVARLPYSCKETQE